MVKKFVSLLYIFIKKFIKFFIIISFLLFLSFFSSLFFYLYIPLCINTRSEIHDGFIAVYDDNEYLELMDGVDYKCARNLYDIPFTKIVLRIILIETGFGTIYDWSLVGRATYYPMHLAVVKDKDVYLWSFKQSKFVFLPTDSSFFDKGIIKNVAKDCEVH